MPRCACRSTETLLIPREEQFVEGQICRYQPALRQRRRRRSVDSVSATVGQGLVLSFWAPLVTPSPLAPDDLAAKFTSRTLSKEDADPRGAPCRRPLACQPIRRGRGARAAARGDPAPQREPWHTELGDARLSRDHHARLCPTALDVSRGLPGRNATAGPGGEAAGQPDREERCLAPILFTRAADVGDGQNDVAPNRTCCQSVYRWN